MPTFWGEKVEIFSNKDYHPIELSYARSQDRLREAGLITAVDTHTRNQVILAAKEAISNAITSMAAHFRIAFTAAEVNESGGRIEGITLNVLCWPKLPTLSNSHPGISLDWVAEHEDGGLYVSVSITQGAHEGMSIEANFDKGEKASRRMIYDRWGAKYPIETQIAGEL